MMLPSSLLRLSPPTPLPLPMSVPSYLLECTALPRPCRSVRELRRIREEIIDFCATPDQPVMAAWEETDDEVKMKHMLDASSPVKEPIAYTNDYEDIQEDDASEDDVSDDDASDYEQKSGGTTSSSEDGGDR